MKTKTEVYKMDIKKMTLAALLVAVAVAASPLSIPLGAAKVFPVQHVVNVVSAVLLGPVYAVMQAFLTSLIRNMAGTGTLLAFPGSMVGALLAGILHEKLNNRGKVSLIPAFIGEVFGTGILGAIAAYPIATLIMGKNAAVFAYVVPFLLSTLTGSIIAFIILKAIQGTGLLGTNSK